MSGFELTYRDSGNSNFHDTSFSASQKITIPKYNTVSYSWTEKKLFKNAFVVFYENSFIAAAYTLKYE